MRLLRRLPIAAFALGALAATTGYSFAQNTPGPYTVAQATAGAALYAANCTDCHGAKLEGGTGPALAGDAFISQWNGQTAADVYSGMSTQMPMTSPGSLKPAEYLALMAYILQQNKYPAGPAALDATTLKTVKIAAQKG